MASGRGSNAKALMEKAGELSGIEIKCLISDNVDAPVLNLASQFSVESFCFPVNKEIKNIPARKLAQEEQILTVMKEKKIDWVLLAGYMRLLSAEFLAYFYDPKLKLNRVINIHPSLLPKFKGANGYEQAFAAGEEVSGVTVHYVVPEMDSGPIILQAEFSKIAGETFETFKQRGLALEHQVYPRVLAQLAEGSLCKNV